MNYRRYYEIETGVKLPVNFDVHHIDINRENNDILNLVALPTGIHKIYHQILRDTPHEMTLFLKGNSEGLSLSYIRFFKFHIIASRWIDYRDHLLGFIPNIHNLSYEILEDITNV